MIFIKSSIVTEEQQNKKSALAMKWPLDRRPAEVCVTWSVDTTAPYTAWQSQSIAGGFSNEMFQFAYAQFGVFNQYFGSGHQTPQNEVVGNDTVWRSISYI